MKKTADRREKLDLLITGGILLTMTDAMEVIPDAVVGIDGGEIVFAGKISDHPLLPEARERIEASGKIILPGLINTHCHAAMVCFRGLADDLPLMEWLHNHIFPVEAKYVNRAMVYPGTLLAAAEMILSGTTTMADGYFFESSACRAAIDAGIRTVPAQGFIDFTPPDDAAIRNHIGIAEKFLRKWRDRSPLVTPALFPHTTYTCHERTLKAVKEAARAEGALYFIHLAETTEENRVVRDATGMTPVRYAGSLGILDPATVAVHAVWIDPEEIRILADTGASVSHSPESNMKLACGIAPVPELLAAGVRVGIGTDGAASNNDLDMMAEMDSCAKIFKVARMDPTVMDAATVLRMATIDGARTLGMDDQIGSVEPGKRADLILVDCRKPRMTPLYNPYSQIVYSANGADVCTSIIEGKVVMKDRRLLTLDLDKAMEEAEKIASIIRRERD
jgi:5-methylthioadenosine/S-adenosylhomocysteine deaminase